MKAAFGEILLVLSASFVLSTLPFALAFHLSDVIPQEILATFHSLPSPISYPQYTNATTGKWIYVVQPTNGLGMADWLDLARSTLLSLGADPE